MANAAFCRDGRWKVSANLVVKLPIPSDSAEAEVITVGGVADCLTDIFGGSSQVWVGAGERSRWDIVMFDPGVMFWWTEATPWGLRPVLRDQLAKYELPFERQLSYGFVKLTTVL